MAVIALEGMHFRAFHGLHEEERIIGNEGCILERLEELDVCPADSCGGDRKSVV